MHLVVQRILLSAFRAELHAISLALSLIRRSKEKNFITFSDSMSSLEAISGFKLEIDIVHNIINDYPVMSISVAMRGLTLQQNQLFLCPLQI